MNICPICRNETFIGICETHHFSEPTWAEENRIMNDFLMRGIEPQRVEKPIIGDDAIQRRTHYGETWPV